MKIKRTQDYTKIFTRTENINVPINHDPYFGIICKSEK